MSGSPPPRWPRAAMFAAVCVGVSVAGHALTSGHAVAPTSVAAGFLLVLWIAYALTGRELRFWPICGWMVWGQLALHPILSVGQPSAAAPAASAGHGAHAVPLESSADGGLAMLFAHLLASVVSAWWLRQGESSVFALLRIFRTVLRDALIRLVIDPGQVPARHPGRVRSYPRAAPRGPAAQFLRHVVVSRGPPVPS
ncbi:hypothetical protein F4561_005350 [Lipingzhangella halophila]|uniref:Uncharacterized protein n=1 Tax=Lipingzhangella halophila TaxID=1783352 RepID=A0A7W7W657_9ACTN|nr:hypothetical protein [Lipingzhangella halophila]MBB4934530.1 hypothetical protein [Lipingzhangella halophila]